MMAAHDRTAAFLFLLFNVLSRSSTALPPFSWDRVPTYIHFANQSGAFDEDAVKQLAKQSFVVFEKDQGRWPQPPQAQEGYPMDYENYAEQKINFACKQVKELSPTT